MNKIDCLHEFDLSLRIHCLLGACEVSRDTSLLIEDLFPSAHKMYDDALLVC